jgi:hypothetical protein
MNNQYDARMSDNINQFWPLLQWLRDCGLSPLPIAPAQPADQFPQVGADGQPRTDKDGNPLPLFTGKNPSYLDKNGTPRIIRHKNYQDCLPTDEEMAEWWANPANGFGYLHTSLAPNLRTLDLDRKNFDSQSDCDAVMSSIASAFPEAWIDGTMRGGYHMAFAFEEPPSFTNFGMGDIAHVGELLGPGRFVAIAPTPGYSRIQDGGFAPTTVESLGIHPRKKATPTTPAPLSMPQQSFGSIPLEMLGNPESLEILNGANPAGDRSASLATAIQEWIGWANWCDSNGVGYRGTPQELAIAAGSTLDIDADRVTRILATIDPAKCTPAAQHLGGDDACWKRVAKLDRRYQSKAYPQSPAPSNQKPQPKPVAAPITADAAAELQDAAKILETLACDQINIHELLPADLAQPLERAAADLNIGIVGLLAPLLSASASLIGGSTISPKLSWTEQPTIWSAVVAASGQGKSPGQRAILGPLTKLDEIAGQQYDQDLLQYQRDKAEWERLAKAHKKESDEELPPPPEPPNYRHYLMREATIETLLAEHCKNSGSRGILFLKEELAGLVLGMNQYKSAGNDRQTWLDLADGSSIKRATKAGVNRRVDSNICVFGGIQPKVLDKMADSEDSDGLWARFLWFTLPYCPAQWNENGGSLEGLLLNLYQTLAKFAPQNYTLEPEAKELFVTYWTEQRNRALNCPSGIANAYSKSPRHVLAVALNLYLLAAATTPELGTPQPEIPLWCISAAIKVVNHSLSQICRRNADTAVELTPQQRKLIELSIDWQPVTGGWIKTRDAISRIRYGGQRVSSDDVKALFEEMVAAGLGEIKTTARGAIEWRYNVLTGTISQNGDAAMGAVNAALNAAKPLSDDGMLPRLAASTIQAGQGFEPTKAPVLPNSQKKNDEKKSAENGAAKKVAALAAVSQNLGAERVVDAATNAATNAATEKWQHSEGTATATATVTRQHPTTQSAVGKKVQYLGSDSKILKWGTEFTVTGFIGLDCGITHPQWSDPKAVNPYDLEIIDG